MLQNFSESAVHFEWIWLIFKTLIITNDWKDHGGSVWIQCIDINFVCVVWHPVAWSVRSGRRSGSRPAAQCSWRGGAAEGVSQRHAGSSADQRAVLRVHQLRMWGTMLNTTTRSFFFCVPLHHVSLVFLQLWISQSSTRPYSCSSVCCPPATVTPFSAYFTSCLTWPITRRIPGTLTGRRWGL